MSQRIAFGLIFVVACGGGKNDADPRLISGGGIGDGAVDGVLNVYVIDEEDDSPVASATVMVGEPGAEPLEGVTDSSGLYRFEDDALGGPQVITVVASGYVVASWYGANGANVTVPLAPEGDTNVPQATLSGTITGWDALAPPTDHFYIALIGYSQSPDLGDAANNLPQGGGGGGLPANACINSSFATSCDWDLNSRTGPVAIYAPIIDVDTNGTPTDDTDDTWTMIGLAYDLSVTVEDGVDQSGLALTMVDEGTLSTPMLTLAASPSGLTETMWGVGVDIADAGFMLFFGGGEQNIEMMVPELSGDFADATYRCLAFTSDGAEDGAQSVIIQRGLTDVSDVDMGAWLPLPGAPAVSAGSYSYTAVEGAAIHIVDLEDGGSSVWNIALFDGRTEFTLPAVDPSPLPSGAVDMRVSAIESAEINLNDFSIDEIADTFTRISANVQAVTP